MSIRRQRRYSVGFKLQLIRAYLAEERSLKGIAGRHDINHSLLILLAEEARAGRANGR